MMRELRGWWCRWCLFSLSWLVALMMPGVSAARSFNAHRTLATATQWLNTSRPLTADDFRGRLILVDFWTYACINCQRVAAELKQLETERGQELTVIGVHSAKFDSEKESDSLRDAVLRYEITHPVANDADFKIWNAFGVTAWPTLILIDPTGGVLKRYAGEGHVAEIRKDIADYLTQHSKSPGTTLAELPVALEKTKEPAETLRFPGKVIWASYEGRPHLFIADTGHHRVLGIALDGPNLGKVRFRIGKADESGRAEGDFESARFHSPQGLAYDAGMLYVADTGNHLIRAVDLAAGKVSTLAGTGEAGNVRTAVDLPAATTALSSPWDVAVIPGKRLAIAMAGTQQIWVYDRDKKTLSVLAGNGTESIDDGAYPDNTLAQPSGLSALGDKLFFVDSESSSLRVWEGGRVTTLIGTGLFDFGFRDGIAGRALMQHPLGVYADKEGIFVADSFNHAIRRFDPSSGSLETIAGNGHRGPAASGPASQALFAEPAGIGGAKGVLYIADTDNSAVRVIDLKEKRVEPLILVDSGSTERAISAVRQLSADLPRVVVAPATQVSSQNTVGVHLEIEQGWKLNPQGPSWLALFQLDDKGAGTLVKEFGRHDLTRARVKLPALADGVSYRLQGTFYFCESRRNSLCLLRSYDQTVKADPSQETTSLPIALPH